MAFNGGSDAGKRRQFTRSFMYQSKEVPYYRGGRRVF